MVCDSATATTAGGAAADDAVPAVACPAFACGPCVEGKGWLLAWVCCWGGGGGVEGLKYWKASNATRASTLKASMERISPPPPPEPCAGEFGLRISANGSILSF